MFTLLRLSTKNDQNVSLNHHTTGVALDFHTLICALALLSSPSVVCRLQSGPRGMRDFNLSKHRRRCARLWEET